jgi:nitrite reductase (NADH) small subunit
MAELISPVVIAPPPAYGKGVRVAVARVDALPTGQGRCFSIGEFKIVLFRQRDGTVFATEAACPHRGGPLADGLIGGGVVVCPLHGYRFRLADGTGIDSEFRLKTHPVDTSDGSIFVTLPKA